MKKKIKYGFVFFGPLLIWVFLWASSWQTGTFLAKGTATTSSQQQNVPATFTEENWKIFLPNILNIPISIFHEKVCIINQNKLFVSLDGKMVDPFLLPIENKEYIGAININFTSSDGTQADVYGKVGTTTCQDVGWSQFYNARVNPSFSFVLLSTTTKSGIGSTKDATTTIDARGSRLNMYMEPWSAFWLLILCFIGFNGSVLFLNSIYKYLKE